MFGLAADGKTNRKGMPNALRLAVIAKAHFEHGAAAISAGSPSAARTHARRTTWPRLRLPADLRARLRLDQEFHDARAHKRSHLGTSIIDRPLRAAREGSPSWLRRGRVPRTRRPAGLDLTRTPKHWSGAAFGSRSLAVLVRGRAHAGTLRRSGLVIGFGSMAASNWANRVMRLVGSGSSFTRVEC